jgi:hypothetical protein
MRILILDPCYPEFLDSFFAEHPDLQKRSYAEQWRAFMDQFFGAADFYSSNLINLGHEAEEIVPNAETMQRQWARENNLKLDDRWEISTRGGVIPWPRRVTRDWVDAILVAQVKQYRPDVLYVQDVNNTSPSFLREVRPFARLIAGQIACPIAPATNFREYDLVISSFPHYVERFRNQGLHSEYLRWAFEPRVLDKLEKTEQRGVAFIGGVSPEHQERINLLEAIAAHEPLEFWGYGVDCLDAGSALRQCYRGQAGGLKMYQLLHSAKIALNHHINAAEDFANNMRLYEASGVGTLVLTDYKQNLGTLFDVGKEVVAYHSVDECREMISHYLNHEPERESIARAGQKRTLSQHTYYHRMQELVELLTRYL